jgi:GH15 family glucan-1,4-alpha-glucosidase
MPPGEESPFLACTAWLGEVYARQGRHEEALAAFSHLALVELFLALNDEAPSTRN